MQEKEKAPALGDRGLTDRRRAGRDPSRSKESIRYSLKIGARLSHQGRGQGPRDFNSSPATTSADRCNP